MTRKLLLPLLALAALALPSRAAIADLEAIAPDGFARGVILTVAGYDAGRATLTDFPVLVRIAEYNATAGTGIQGFDYDDLMFKSTGDDICFVAEDGTPLAFEIDTWNTAGESLVWVKLPSMQNGTEFAMFYRSSKKGKVDVCTANPFADYVGVWHLGETGSGNSSTKVFDSSGNGLTGTATGGKCLSVAASEGVLGGSWRFNDAYARNNSGIIVDLTDQTKLDTVNALGTDFTVSFWMKPYGAITKKDGVCWNALIGRKTDGNSNYWGLQLDEDPKNLRIFGSNGKDKASARSYNFTQNTWFKIDVAFYKDASNKGKYCYYVNGGGYDLDKALSGDKVAAQGTGPLGIGNFTQLSAERGFWGAMDEVRLVVGTNSADRVAADYATVATPSFLVASQVTEFEEEPKPVIGHAISDVGAAFVQFSGSISALGGTATSASILVKVWPTTGSEPSGWTTITNNLGEGAAFTAILTGLEPLSGYTYLIKAVNDLAEPYDSDVATGTFTTSGVGDAGTGGAVERQLDDFVHVFLVSERGQSVYEFTPPADVDRIDALVVAGGGPGGYYAGGGGGAGGLIYTEDIQISGGETYAITIGTGGVASASATVYGSNGGNSSIVGPSVNLVAVGGGAGGNGRLNNQGTTRAGVAGGSGGGSSWTGNAAGAGTANQGNAGGTTSSAGGAADHAGGGGGAGGAGGSVVQATGAQSSGAGGIGREIAITGEPVYYAGGGGGGGVKSFVNNGYGSAGTGGAGGGGLGGQETDATGSSVAESGTDGLGGGGGGGSTVTGREKGGNGGNGVVIIRYGAGGDGDGVVSPTISLTGLTYDDATGVATVTYRVGWAGDGYDRADVSAIWGYDEDKLVYTNAVSTAPAIGQGTGSFSPPRMSRTIFVRLLATNTGHYAGVSPEVKTLVLFNPAAPAGTVAATPSYTTASFAAAVTNLGAGATSVSGAFQVCADRFFDEGTYTTFAANEPILAAGTLSGSATGLSPNTTYWVRASLTNDIPADYDTAPVSFRTLEMGAPAGTAGVPTASDTTISAEITVSDFGVGATSATMRLEASATDDFAALAASADIAATTGVAQALTVSGLSPETTYFLRAVLENDGGLRTVLDLGSATTTRAVVGIPVSFTIPELPPNVSVASVSTNGIEVLPVEGAYTVLDGSSVVVTFAAAQGYVLSGAPVSTTVVANGDTTFPAASIPTATTAAQAIRINEIMASNPSADKGGIVSAKGIAEMDWVEFYNASSEAIDITGWHLSDNAKPGKEDKATILGSCVIPAKGYKIVWLDKIHVDPSEYAADEAFAVLKLSSSGEFLQLADPGKAVVQQVDFSTKKQIKGYSYGPLSVSSGAGLVPGDGPFVYMKTATPGAANATVGFGDFTPAVAFSEPHGYKTAAFDLELSCPDDPTAQIYYTLDGSSPTTASILYTNAIPISKTTVVRAAVPVENTILQFDTSATYIFLDDVLAQARSTTAPASAVGFPDDNAVNGQEMLYGMEQGIVTGADRDRLLRGFTNSIATLSIVVDPANLFNSTTGIYVNPRGEGETWERQIMLEGFDPTGVGADFAQPAGIRIRGGFSRQNNKPKHSLRFFFRSSYGESSLAQKMFVGEPLSLNGEGKMKEEAGEYDKLDLRTSQNASWANENSDKDTFVTEVFSRDSQRDLGQPYTRSRYYNLFINGQYWGLYQTQERGDEHWGEAYLGGDSLQYDLIKTASTYVNNKLSYSIECNEGTWDAWSNLWHIATQEGFGEGHEANYNKVLGLNPDGTRNPAYPVLLNAESLMVYMLVSHYVVDQDGPTSPFSSIDKGHANNFYAIRNRDDAGAVKGFVFLRHDAEMSMGQNGNTGASQNPTLWGTEAQTSPTVGSPDPTGLGNQKFRTIPYFTPAELHYLLMQNPVYKRQYADLFYRECLREGGAMTVENATARYTSRMAEIDDAIVCEAARWGKSKNRSTWLSACSRSVSFITNRVGNMKTQYQTAGWYPTVAAPFVTDADGVRYFDGGEVPYQEKVYLQNNEPDGTLYYTIDGTDPADSGIEYTAPFSIPDSGATVRARLFKDNEWSPLEEVSLEMDIPNDQRYGIRIAAIMSIVPDPPGDPAGEFIVLTNVLDRAVSLNGLSVWSEKNIPSLVKLSEISEDIEIPAGGTFTLTSARWIGDAKLKNDGIYVQLRDINGKRIQNTFVNAKSWFLADPDNAKSGACNKTGRWLIALEFLGDTDGGEVTEEKQWTPSPEAPSTVTLTVPAVANATVSATTNGVALAGADDGNGNTVFTIEPGTAVTVTYTAAEGYHVAGSANDVTTAVYEVSAADTAADHTLAVDATMVIVAHAAVISVADAETGACTTNAIYTTLAEAVAAASDGETVLLLADDSASFTTDNLEIGIGKSITIDGDGHRLYGLDDYTGGRGDHDIYISGTADITIRNITLADFGGAVPVTGRTYPIWTGSAYSGTLTLDNVTVTNFNRTAFNLNGGTVIVRNCTIAGDMGKGFPCGVFQEGIGAYNANVTVENTTITGAGSTYEKEDSQIAACIQLGNPNGPAPGTGSITVRSGTFAGQYGIIVASNAMNAVTVQGGAFTGALLAEEGEGGSIAVSGGTFDAPVPAEFAADGYAPTTIADNDGRYTVRTARTVSFTVDGASYTNLVVADGEPVAQPADPVSDAYVFTGWTLNGAAYEFSTPVTDNIELEAAITSLAAAIWIAGAQGDWETAANWDIGYVPTKATIVTFTNDAQVAILGSTDRCKELVLSNATVTLVRDANATKPVLHFHGNEGRAVSVASGATGSLGVNGIALFTESTDRDNNLTIGCALAVLGDVTFRGINIVPNQLAASFTITGKTTISADATVKTIDWGNTIFLGGIEVAKGVTAKIQTDPNGYAQIGAAVTLVANDGEGDSTTIWLMRSSNRSGKVSLVLGASVSVDADHAATHFIKTSSDEVTDENGLNPITCDVYEAARNPAVFVTTYGVTVSGVESGQRVVPGTNLVIGVSGFAAGYEPSVTIMKHEDYSVLLTTNAVSFTYTMPDFDIDVVADATPPSYKDPEGHEIQDQGLISWLADNGFTQEDINDLGSDAAATDKLYECWLLNCSITAENPGGTIHTTGIAVTNGVVSIRVRLDRNAPLGFINGVVHLYGAETLAGGFSGSLVSEEIVGFSEGDTTFDIDPTEASVAQSVTATFSPDDVTARFFKSAIEFPSADNGEGGDEGGEED